ncbi:MAG: hypothetical protein Q8Q67_00105 [bacterium]|nr:hypothetical protein [bacterium]
MSINDQLMRASATTPQNEQPDDQADESAERSGSLREQKRAEGGDNYPPENYFAARYGAKVKNRKEQAEKEKQGGRWQSFKKSMSSGPSKFLISAYRNIPFTFGASFFYVYAHLFLKNVFGDDKFAPLGSEWFDRPGITKAMRDKYGAKVKTVETMGVLLISLILFVAVLTSFIIPSLVVEVAANPLRSGLQFLESIFSS